MKKLWFIVIVIGIITSMFSTSVSGNSGEGKLTIIQKESEAPIIKFIPDEQTHLADFMGNCCPYRDAYNLCYDDVTQITNVFIQGPDSRFIYHYTLFKFKNNGPTNDSGNVLLYSANLIGKGTAAWFNHAVLSFIDNVAVDSVDEISDMGSCGQYYDQMIELQLAAVIDVDIMTARGTKTNWWIHAVDEHLSDLVLPNDSPNYWYKLRHVGNVMACDDGDLSAEYYFENEWILSYLPSITIRLYYSRRIHKWIPFAVIPASGIMAGEYLGKHYIRVKSIRTYFSRYGNPCCTSSSIGFRIKPKVNAYYHNFPIYVRTASARQPYETDVEEFPMSASFDAEPDKTDCGYVHIRIHKIDVLFALNLIKRLRDQYIRRFKVEPGASLDGSVKYIHEWYMSTFDVDKSRILNYYGEDADQSWKD